MAEGRRIRKVLRGLYETDDRARWTAVREIGEFAANEATEAQARQILRRLAWSLNDESGAVGWGAPEAIGEILALRPEFQAEYAGMFPQWLGNEDVVLDNAILDTGAIWALGRIGPDAPFHHDDLAALLRPYLERGTASVKGAVAWAAGRLGLPDLAPLLEPLVDLDDPVTLLLEGEVREMPLGDLAREALAALV